MGPNDNGWNDALSGLKLHVHVVPCSFEMVTELPEAALLARTPVPAALHTAAARPATSNTKSTLFMFDPSSVVLRPCSRW